MFGLQDGRGFFEHEEWRMQVSHLSDRLRIILDCSGIKSVDMIGKKGPHGMDRGLVLRRVGFHKRKDCAQL